MDARFVVAVPRLMICLYSRVLAVWRVSFPVFSLVRHSKDFRKGLRSTAMNDFYSCHAAADTTDQALPATRVVLRVEYGGCGAGLDQEHT